MTASFSASRVNAIMLKEFIQMRRDRLTFAMIVGIPTVQLVLFGYAINTDPKHLPTAAIISDSGPVSRAILAAMQNSGYFDVAIEVPNEVTAHSFLTRGDVSFVVTIPAQFERKLIRGEHPQILIEADATDPSAAAGGLGALPEIVRRAVDGQLNGPLSGTKLSPPPVETVLHRLYNPEGVTAYNIVPGLLGVILTMTTILITSLALTREVERGTMENLLTMPTRPHEIMIGKIVPYIGFGLAQVAIILCAGQFLFNVPLIGSLTLLLTATLLFIAANVTLGYTISTLARTQMQAMQMTFFVFLPSIMLSGFMFPFRGMPTWAQAIGEVIPLTHFLRIVRGVMLKGAGLPDIAHNIWPLALFWLVVATVALVRYRRTLD